MQLGISHKKLIKIVIDVQTLGKRGRVKRIFDDGDVRVKIGANSWTYNPELLSAADESDNTSTSSGDESGSDSDGK